jgi:hypothetical protein
MKEPSMSLMISKVAFRPTPAALIAPAIPCHRAWHAAMVGYRWGIERKRELIMKETMV